MLTLFQLDRGRVPATGGQPWRADWGAPAAQLKVISCYNLFKGWFIWSYCPLEKRFIMGFAALRMFEEVNQDSSDWDRYGSCPQEQYRCSDLDCDLPAGVFVPRCSTPPGSSLLLGKSPTGCLCPRKTQVSTFPFLPGRPFRLISCSCWLVVSSETDSTHGWTRWLEEMCRAWCFSQPDSHDLSSSSSGLPEQSRKWNNTWRTTTLTGATPKEALVSTKRSQRRQRELAGRESWSWR